MNCPGEESINISNIKYQLKITNPERIENIRRHLRSHISKVKQSFFILRYKKATYSVFNSGHVNITGVTSFSSVRQSTLELENILRSKCTSLVIDNITSCKLLNYCQDFNLLNFVTYLSTLISIDEHSSTADCCIRRIKYNREKFPGAFIKTNIGTVLLFASQRCVFVGTNSISQTKYIQDFMTRLHADYVCQF